MTPLELDRILTFDWPILLRRVMADLHASDFAKGFTRSIARHGKRPAWHPTPKQAHLMRSLLREYSAPPEPELVVIED